MEAHFSKKKQRMGLLFGTIAGLAFSLTAWGIDAIQLAQAHAAYPLLKFIPGLIISVLTGAIVGWLTIRLDRLWIGMLLWAMLAGVYTWLVMWLPLKGSPTLLSLLEPNQAHLLYYPSIESQSQFAVMGLIVNGFVALICGLMEIHLIDQAMMGMGTLALISPLLISFAVFALAGTSGDYLINRHFRESMQAMDELIQFAADNEGKEVPAIVARQKRLSVVKDLDDLITYPRKLTLIGYDEMLGQMDILVDFNGNWVRCSVIYNQPTMCKRLMLDSLRFACDETTNPNSCFNVIGYDKNITKMPNF